MNDRIHPAYNAQTGKMELVFNHKPIYQFRSAEEYRTFSLSIHAMENPLAETQPSK